MSTSSTSKIRFPSSSASGRAENAFFKFFRRSPPERAICRGVSRILQSACITGSPSLPAQRARQHQRHVIAAAPPFPLCRKAPGPMHPHPPDTPPLSTPLPAAMPTGVQDRCAFQISAAEPRPAQAVHRNTAHTPHPDAPARAPASVPAALEDGVCTPAPARIRHMDRKSPKPHRRKGSGAGTEYPRTAQTAALIFQRAIPPLFTAFRPGSDRPDRKTVCSSARCAPSAPPPRYGPQGYKAFLHV